jgi:galactokinase
MMKAMRSSLGILGARQAGAGFGGCMVAFVTRDQVEDFVQQVKASYMGFTDILAKVYPVQAAPGAGVLTTSIA